MVCHHGPGQWTVYYGLFLKQLTLPGSVQAWLPWCAVSSKVYLLKLWVVTPLLQGRVADVAVLKFLATVNVYWRHKDRSWVRGQALDWLWGVSGAHTHVVLKDFTAPWLCIHTLCIEHVVIYATPNNASQNTPSRWGVIVCYEVQWSSGPYRVFCSSRNITV